MRGALESAATRRVGSVCGSTSESFRILSIQAHHGLRAFRVTNLAGPLWTQFRSFFRLFFGHVFLMLFDRFRLRFWLHFGTQNAPKNESKKQLIFQPILSGFWSILGASRAPLGDHFGLQKSMKKHPSSKDPSRDAQWTPKGSKMKQNGPLRLPKWTKNGAKMKRNGSHPG